MTTDAPAASRTATMAFAAQGLARRGAAASAEGLTGFIELNEAMVRALHRERARIERRRLGLIRVESARQACAAALAA